MASILVYVKKNILSTQKKNDALNREEKRKRQNGPDGQNGVNALQHVMKVSSIFFFVALGIF